MKKIFFQILIKILILMTFFCCISCRVAIESTPSDWNWGLRPRPLTGTRNFPSANTEYGKGFRDGCSSAMNAVAKGMTSDLAEGRFDYTRSKKSQDYGVGWFDGLEQCTYIIDWDVL